MKKETKEAKQITVSLADLLFDADRLLRLMQLPKPIDVAWELTKAHKVIEEALKDYQKLHNDLIKQLGVQDGENYSMKDASPENQAEFLKQRQTLWEKELTLNMDKLDALELITFLKKRNEMLMANNQPEIALSDELAIDWLFK